MCATRWANEFIGSSDHLWIKVVLLYPDISNFTFWNVKNFRCKNFLIDFLNELGNFKQKKIYTSKCKFFLHIRTTDPYSSQVTYILLNFSGLLMNFYQWWKILPKESAVTFVSKEKHPCEICGFAVNKAHLKLHINEVHLKLKNYSCEKWDFSCFRKCSICGKTFCSEG